MGSGLNTCQSERDPHSDRDPPLYLGGICLVLFSLAPSSISIIFWDIGSSGFSFTGFRLGLCFCCALSLGLTLVWDGVDRASKNILPSVMRGVPLMGSGMRLSDGFWLGLGLGLGLIGVGVLILC